MQVQWNDQCNQAFEDLKNLLCSSPVLQSPDFEKPFILQTDASDRGLGALPSQRDDSGSDHPVAYYSRKLLPREERYSTTAIEKECKEKYKSVDVPLPDLSNGLPVHR